MTNRNKNFIKQLKLSFLYRIVSILIMFLLIRQTLNYLGSEKYGIWALLLTIMNWIIFFDFGIANGIKNKVAESLSIDDKKLANEYISTGYIIISALSIIIFIIFIFLSNYISWQSVFNVFIISEKDLSLSMILMVVFVLINFILSICIAVFNATQQASLIVLRQLLYQLFASCCLFVLSKFIDQSLVWVVAIYGFSLMLSNIFLSIFFYKKHSFLSPKILNYKSKKIKTILGLGVKFFYLQLVLLCILNTDTFITAHLLGTSYISSYDILYKYFGVLLIANGIINTPLWSMYTEAYIKNDYMWISSIIKKMFLMLIVYIGIGLVLYYFRNFIIDFWIGDNTLPLFDSNYLYMLLMMIIWIWYLNIATFTNGINKTKNQIISSTIGLILNLPLSIYFVKVLNLGLNGILLATCISLLIFSVSGTVQVVSEIRKIKNKKSYE